MGRLPAGLWSQKDVLQPLRALGRAWDMGGYFQRACRSGRGARPAVHRQHLYQGPPDGRRRKRRALANGIGQTRGGRNSKVHAICDLKGRPLVLLITPGNVHDMRVAIQCIAAMPPSRELVGDKGYCSKPLRAWLAERGTKAVIPSKGPARLRSRHLKATQRRRAHVLLLQRLAKGRNPLRPQHQKLHGYHRHRRYSHLVALMSLDPRS